MSRAAALLELRVRLVWRRVTGREGIPEAVALLVLFAVVVPLGLAAAAVLAVGSFRAVREGAGLAQELSVTATLFAVWQAWTAVSVSLHDREALDLRRFLAYPVPPARVYLLGVAAGLVGDPVAIFWLLLLGGAFAGAAAARPGPWLLLLGADYAAFAAATVFGVLLVQQLLARLARRRAREWLVLAGLAGAVLLVGARPHLGNLRAALAFARGAQWVALPPALAAAAARRLYGGDVLAAAPWIAGLVAVAAATGALAYRLALAAARGGGEGTAAAAVRRGAARRVPLVPAALAGLLEKEARALLRHPLARVHAIVVPAFAAIVGWRLVPFLGAGAGGLAPAAPLLAFAAYTHLVTQVFWLNGFGVDRGGARAYCLAPVDPRHVLLAKNAAAYALSLAVFALAAVAAALAGGRPPGWAVASALALHAGIAPILYGAGNLVAVASPRAVPDSAHRGSGVSAVGALAGLGILAAALAIFSVPALLALRLGGPWLLVAVWAPLAAVALLAYAASLRPAAALLERRREPLLDAVCGDDA